MRIEAIKTYEAFVRLKGNWEAVYAADPEAHFFLSWTWLSKWFQELTWPWVILAARPASEASPYFAFFPLKYHAQKANEGKTVIKIAAAGSRLADYTGFISSPAFRNEVAQAFLTFIKSRKWNDFDLENVLASDEILNIFLKNFPKDDFVRMQVIAVDKTDNIDNSICPYVRLPADWESYLRDSLSTNTRQKVRRFLRKLDTCGELRITHADTGTIENNVDILLGFWITKWGDRKGDQLGRTVKTVRTMLMHCFDNGSLFLPVLWKDDRPVGALASFIDRQKKSLLFFIAGRDQAMKNPPPGFILHAYSIRYAISNGFTTYDFLRGNESYKYLFGAEERQIRHLVIRAKNEQERVGSDAVGMRSVMLPPHPAPLREAGRP